MVGVNPYLPYSQKLTAWQGVDSLTEGRQIYDIIYPSSSKIPLRLGSPLWQLVLHID
jgi:hypothetical protein